MTQEQLFENIERAFIRITGMTTNQHPDITGPVFRLLDGKPDEIIHAVLKTASEEYDGFSTCPSESFWRLQVKRALAEHARKTGKHAVKVDKPSEQERLRVAQQAKEIAEMFEKMSPQYSYKKSAVHERVKRMKEQVLLGNVMIEQCSHALEGMWIPKKDADEANLLYLNPSTWLKGRETIKK